MLTFLKHDNISAKNRCKFSGQHLNSKGVSLFHENHFLNLLNTVDLKIDIMAKIMRVYKLNYLKIQ